MGIYVHIYMYIYMYRLSQPQEKKLFCANNCKLQIRDKSKLLLNST